MREVFGPNIIRDPVAWEAIRNIGREKKGMPRPDNGFNGHSSVERRSDIFLIGLANINPSPEQVGLTIHAIERELHTLTDLKNRGHLHRNEHSKFYKPLRAKLESLKPKK